MRLVSFRKNDYTGIGLLEGDLIINPLNALHTWSSQAGYLAPVSAEIISEGMQSLLQAGKQAMEGLSELRQQIVSQLAEMPDRLLNLGITSPLDEVSLLPPVLRPGKLVCVGLNYPPIPPGSFDPPAYPVLFHKTATSLAGQGAAVYLPPEVDYLEYEGELAVVIGRVGRRIPPERGWEYVAGLTIANDVGAPQIQARSSQWTSGKMLDSFCPLGPALVTCDELLEPGNLRLRTWLNDELVQDACTGEMRFDVPALVSYISGLATLEPGDVILTGSPRRRGDTADPRLPVRPGDRMRVEIEGLGRLENPVLKEALNHAS